MLGNKSNAELLRIAAHTNMSLAQMQQQAGGQVQQVKVRDVEQEERVQGLVDETLKELPLSAFFITYGINLSCS